MKTLIAFCGVILILVLSCSTPQESGILQGYVTIGPIQPVVRPGQEIEVPCAVYEARKIMVYSDTGKKLIE